MNKKEIIGGLIALVIFGIIFSLVFDMYTKEGKEKTIVELKKTTDSKNYLDIVIKVVAMDPLSGDMTTRVFISPKGDFIDKYELLKKNIYFYTNSASGRQDFLFEKGMQVNPVEIEYNVYGLLTKYPFDEYDSPIIMFSELRKTNEIVDTTLIDTEVTDDIPISISFEGSLHGYNFHAESDTTVNKIYSAINVNIHRSNSTLFFSVFIMIAMWLLSGIVILLVLSVVVRKRKVELGMMAFISAMIFALPALRNMQPLVPSIGTFSDYVSFFWAESFMAISLFVIVLTWLRRPPEKS
ncbi:MAG TPA: hypothetical protein DIS94_02545 [Bacteroidetes bacterium]|nr:hypothetical protein [Bacteroidota bacterium]